MDITIDTSIDSMVGCPSCGKETGQVKAGLTQGVQRYKCNFCRHRYIQDRKERGHPAELREQAIHMYRQGMNNKHIAGLLKVSPTSVAHWIRPMLVAKEEEEGASSPAVVPTAGQAIPEEAGGSDESGYSGYGRGRATISDVARTASVSTTTVSNYLNSKGHMREETRQRIEAAIEQLHFSPSALVRAIRKKRTYILGVLLFGIYDIDQSAGSSLAPPLLAGINTAADQAGYDILLYTGWPHSRTRQAGLDFLDGNVDGMIWVAPNMTEPALERVARAGLPVVSVLSRHVPEQAGFVNTDNFGSVRALIDHLVERGHRRIAFLGSTHDSDSRDRRDAYRQTLAAYGLPWDAGLEGVLPYYSNEEQKYLPWLERWASQDAPPTAVLTLNDGFASFVIDAFQRLGRRVPEDFSVCGFDDIPDARFIGGGLTTIRQPFREIGFKAVECLLALIGGAPTSECRVTLPGSLVIRASTSYTL